MDYSQDSMESLCADMLAFIKVNWQIQSIVLKVESESDRKVISEQIVKWLERFKAMRTDHKVHIDGIDPAPKWNFKPNRTKQRT